MLPVNKTFLLAALVLAGCAHDPMAKPKGPATPAAFSQGGAVADAKWAEAFGDPALLELIAQARKNSPDLVIARARQREAVALLLAANAGDGWVVAQEYLPEAEAGEKRLFWLNGELLGGYLRLRAPGDFRHNLKLGGQPTVCTVDDVDRTAVAALGPHLEAAGVWLAGVDVIGGRIVEVNVLNPGGAHFTTLLGGVEVGDRLVDALSAPGRPDRAPPVTCGE